MEAVVVESNLVSAKASVGKSLPTGFGKANSVQRFCKKPQRDIPRRFGASLLLSGTPGQPPGQETRILSHVMQSLKN